MRFDTARAMEWTGAFTFSRRAGSDDERRAAQIVGEELERLGLRVERREIEGKRVPDPALPWLGWFGVALWSIALEIATHRAGSWPVRLGLALGALVWLRLTTVEGFVLGGPWLRRFATTNVVAGREREDEREPAPVRVVFHTPLDTFAPGREIVPRWVATPVIAALLGAQVFFDLTINRNPLGLPYWPVAGLCCAILLWLAIGVRIYLLVRPQGGPDVRDNRTGLAVLLELARSWSEDIDARIETRFVVTGGRAFAGAGLRALVHAIRHEWPARPTLVVNLLAPGIGSGLTLVEQGTGQLAAKAAADLWIPHQVAHRAAVARDHRPFGRQGPAFVAMVGSAVAPGSGRPSGPGAAPAIEAEALTRAAQLATEVALRWARQTRQSGNPV